MSTELEPTKMHYITEFGGGDTRGVMLQITRKDPFEDSYFNRQVNGIGVIQVDLEEAVELYNVLGRYMKKEALRRQECLAETVKMYVEMQPTIFREICDLPESNFDPLVVALPFILKLCPVVSPKKN